jgi:4-amino-4-deoxy-L-arabinose transferase-like glycosyltransferase
MVGYPNDLIKKISKLGSNERSWAIFGLLIAAYFPLFLHLDAINLYRWDESLNAVHAYEMSQSGNLVVRTFLGNPETWDTKPPMLTWLQAFFLRTLGYHELSIRLPSALAALGIILFILHFFTRDLKHFSGGVFASLVLLCSPGFIRQHVARTGDHDALVIFFLTAGLLFFFRFVHTPEHRNRNWYLFVLMLVCGTLTKSVIGIIFLPGLFIFVLLEGKLLWLLRQPKLYAGILAFTVLVGGYYLGREMKQPGYLQLVWNNELFPRYFNNADTWDYHESNDAWYYIRLIWKEQFSYFAAWLPLAIIIGMGRGTSILRSFVICLLCVGGSFLFIISGGTINSWYDAPVFPLLAMLTGLGIGQVFNWANGNLLPGSAFRHLFAFLFTIALFSYPYYKTITEQVYQPKYQAQDMKYGDFFKLLRRHHPDRRSLFVFYEPVNTHFHFYQYIYNNHFGFNIRSCGWEPIVNCPETPQPGELIMVCDPGILAQVKEQYGGEIIMEHEGCVLMNIELLPTDQINND